MEKTHLLNHVPEVLLLDKPLGWTSFDVVKKLRGMLKIRKIGHAGTLDPLATGLLILCTGKGTKQIARYQGLDKVYEGSFTLGKTTASYDSETPALTTMSYEHLKSAAIQDLCQRFIGQQAQVPPAYSACKINGVRAYKKARLGEEVTLTPRQVTIHRFEITHIDLPVVRFIVTCSKGTYIRSLAHDFGQALGVGAYLSSLRRTHIGDYHVADAYTIPALQEALSRQVDK